jgi:PD-(D/E)XK nuclease superfamily
VGRRGRVVGRVREYETPMTIVLITGPANSGKAGVVLDALQAHHARGAEPLLVVPTRADVDRYRRELAGAGLVLGARVERFEGLLAEVVRRGDRSPTPRRDRARAGRPLSRLARERVLAAVVSRAGGRAGPTSTPGLVRALAAFVVELETERVSPQRLREALRAWAAADPPHAAHARGILELLEGYHRALSELGRTDPERRAVDALDALRRAPALWGGTPVLLYGFDDFSRLQLDTIETLGTVVGSPVTVSLPYEPGRTAFAGRAGTFQTLLPLAVEHRALPPRREHYEPSARTALHHLERFLFEPEGWDGGGGRTPVHAGGAVRLIEGAGERAELELVAGEIRGLLDRGVAPAEIAVAHRSPATVAELLGEVFRAHGIPHALQRRVRFADTAVGRALLGLLAAALGDQHAEEERSGLEDLLAWLRAPGVLRRPELADRLEARARRTGDTTAAQARALWEAEHWPLQTLDGLRDAAARGPTALIERAARELERLFCAPRLHAASVLAPAELPDARALAVGRHALEELRDLSRRVPELAPDGAELIAILGSLELPLGESSPGLAVTGESSPGVAVTGRPGVAVAAGESEASVHAAVAVADPLALRARRVRVLFLCGLQEGVFPAPPRPEPLLSEDERRGLAQASGLWLKAGGDRDGALAAERYLLYAAVSRPQELLVLSWHTADDDGLASARSLFVDDVCDLFADDLRLTSRDTPRRTPRDPAWHVRDPARQNPGGATRDTPPPTPPTLGGPPPTIAPLRDREVLGQLHERRLWSASALAVWAGCPVRWFVERLLGAEDLDPEPEPLARGGLAHAALRDVLDGLRRETGSARPTPARLPHARRLLGEALERHAADYPLSTAPERVPGVRRRLEADLERYLDHAANQDSPLEPTHLELPFGFPDEREGLPALDLGDGVLVRGRIDRVDVGPGGEAVVYDYKSAYAPEPAKWIGERSFQVALYMRALRALPNEHVVGGFYQPLSGRDLRARGVLSEEDGPVLDCVRGDARERSELEELVEEVVATARDAARQARAGALEGRPQTCGFGGSGCMYPTICRCEQ